MADINKIYELIPKEKFEPRDESTPSTEERLSAIEDLMLDMIVRGVTNE